MSNEKCKEKFCQDIDNGLSMNIPKSTGPGNELYFHNL